MNSHPTVLRNTKEVPKRNQKEKTMILSNVVNYHGHSGNSGSGKNYNWLALLRSFASSVATVEVQGLKGFVSV